MYKIDSGHLSSTEILDLDSTVYNEKRGNFNSAYKRSGNIAGAFLDGDMQTMYYAHSSLDKKTALYKGVGNLVLLKDHPRFSYINVPKYDGTIRINTWNDTEAKLFEYFADLYEIKPFKSITMLSERGMCDSCRGVMKQFQEQFPDVTINVISNKQVQGNVWRYRR